MTDTETQFLAEIENAEFTEAHVEAVGDLLGQIGYTTTALVAFAAAVRDKLGDDKGSMMILAFAAEFARHEATSPAPE